MKFTDLLSFLAIGGFSAHAASPRANAVIHSMEVIGQSHRFIAGSLRGWSGKFMEFMPVRMEMMMIPTLITNATRQAKHSGDLLSSDFDEVLAAATQLAGAAAETMNVFIDHETVIKTAALGFFVATALSHQQKASITFAHAVVGISPSFGPELEDMLGRTISETYQTAIDHFKKKKGGSASEDEQSEQEEPVMP